MGLATSGQVSLNMGKDTVTKNQKTKKKKKCKGGSPNSAGSGTSQVQIFWFFTNSARDLARSSSGYIGSGVPEYGKRHSHKKPENKKKNVKGVPPIQQVR